MVAEKSLDAHSWMLASVLLLLSACATSGASSRSQGGPTDALGGASEAASEADEGAPNDDQPGSLAAGKGQPALPIGIGSEDLSTQRTFTFRYEGPGSDGVLSLTLRLEAADRFLLTGRDRILRRQVWSLAVDGNRGLVVDSRAGTFCWYGGEVELAALPLGPLPLATLPALLLGRVPIPPSGPSVKRDDGGIEFSDARGREWRVRTEEGRVSTWTLYADGEPEVWYSTRGEMRYLSARREELQLRWRENLSETLDSVLPVPEPPGDFVSDCPE